MFTSALCLEKQTKMIEKLPSYLFASKKFGLCGLFQGISLRQIKPLAAKVEVSYSNF